MCPNKCKTTLCLPAKTFITLFRSGRCFVITRRPFYYIRWKRWYYTNIIVENFRQNLEKTLKAITYTHNKYGYKHIPLFLMALIRVSIAKGIKELNTRHCHTKIYI